MQFSSGLLTEYQKSIVKEAESGNLVLNPWWALEDTRKTWRIVDALASIVDTEGVTGLCVLADSGIPIGVPLAQALHLPCYVYRRKAWDLEGTNDPQFLLPSPTPRSTLVLVDSHIDSGVTAGTCVAYLLERNITVKKIAAPFQLPPTGNAEVVVPELPEKVLLQDHLEEDEAKTFGVYFGRERIERATISQHFPSFLRPYQSIVDDIGYLPFKRKRLGFIATSIISRRKAIPELGPFDANLASDLRQTFGSGASQVWDFFAKPDVVKRVCRSAINQIDMGKIDIIVGTGGVGTGLALSLAFNSRFAGMILTTLERGLEWYSPVNYAERPRVLMCTGRLCTGQYVLGAKQRLTELGLGLDSVLALRYAPEIVKSPRDRMISALDNLEAPILVLANASCLTCKHEMC